MITINCKEYKNLEQAFMTSKGKFDYSRFNKEMIQVASKLQKFRLGIDRNFSERDLILIVGEKIIEKYCPGFVKSARGTQALEDRVYAILGLLNELCNRRATSGLKKYIRQRKAHVKKSYLVTEKRYNFSLRN